MKDNNKHEQKKSVYHAILELKHQQDSLDGCPTSCFSTLLSKLYKVDTIPFLLYTDSGLFQVSGVKANDNGKDDDFCTPFFRIEHVDTKEKFGILSLLRPLSLTGYPSEEICDVERLERTEICVKVDLTCICAVQCLDINLMKKVVIEPKW
ncbi:CotY/CotZ family spore coat protein [Metabacillus halosaccharovorans]|uniref:CotY/CotZ family spore coat protein n=1 Tax=Metabacillus halosaccharovorans TaxID=930124 RepID=A0ABT3DL89_9BACI|nr:CotY/CotZ family spore coat protein [Metabacillus halosaccharovorans]MCV9887812.1 CotY/CotZ family spore coat protein [Metabacillus halosaccharovorans]